MAGTRGTVETRTLLLRAGDPITGLQVIPLDLARSDGDTILPASAVQATGANAWGDYFALLVWGFGAEATRAAVTGMVRNWGLPGIE